MTKKIIWRLKEQPTSEMLRELVKDQILTKEEAREILFNLEEQTDRDNESLKSEIRFLKELVEKLSQNKGQIVKIIREIEKPWTPLPWYNPYITWCNPDFTNCTTVITDSGTTGSGYLSQNFSGIKTF